jgi:ATP-dependent Lon protease
VLRMVPFVERNYNLVELGPRGTGKSHLFQQVSPYAHLISGGKATVARMFVNNASGQRGLVCQYDVVCFDEVSGVSFDQKDGVNIMKGYMESGEFSRGKESIRADGSIVLVGNFDVDVEHQQRIGHLSARCRPKCGTTRLSWTASIASCRAGMCPNSIRACSPSTSAW